MYDIILHKFTLRHYIIIEKDFLAFAKKIGVELSEEDIENNCKEMTDEDLAKVAGGMSPFVVSLLITNCIFHERFTHHFSIHSLFLITSSHAFGMLSYP